MKLRYYCILLALALLGFGAFGLSKRGTYTDITADPDFIYDFYVGELDTDLVKSSCEEMAVSLPSSPVILKVTPLDTPEYFCQGRQQKARVEKVFSGDKLSVGDEIYITASHWMVYSDDNSIDTGFVNFMKSEKSYLVFLTDFVGYAEDNQTKVYCLQGENIYAVFCYGSCDNVIYPIAENAESTAAPYSAVADNEFFAAEQEGLDAFLALKEELLAVYN